MKYLIILLVLLTSCEYEELVPDVKILPYNTESVLIDVPIQEVENRLLNEGYTLYTHKNKYSTGVQKVRNIGYFQYELQEINPYTKIRIKYGTDMDNMYYLKYSDDSTKLIFNKVIEIFKEEGIYYEGE